MEGRIRQRRLLFVGALGRQGDRRLPKRLLFAGRLEGGEDPSPGQSAQYWQKSLRDDFKAFGALHNSTPSDRRTFGVDRLVWKDAARKDEGVPWYTGVLLGAERVMASWHKSEEEASRLREVNRAARIKCCWRTRRQRQRQREEARRRRGTGRERKSIERVLAAIASEQLVLPSPPQLFFPALIYLHLGLLFS